MSDLALRERPASRHVSDTRSRVRPYRRLAPAGALVILIALYATCFGWLSLERYWGYEMHALDMGNMGQAAWNTVHGHPFQFTNMRLPYHGIEAWDTTTRLSFHVEVLFPVISTVYLLYPHPESLLVLQTLALALGAIPVFLLARAVLSSDWWGVLFAAVYLLFPSLEAMNLYEFHPVALATPLLLAAFLCAYQRHYLLFVVFCLAAMGTKEQIGLVVATFGLYVAMTRRERRIGLGVAAIGVAWSLFAALVVEHHYRAPGTMTYLHNRYGYLGHGIRGAIHTVVHNPGVFPHTVFTWAKLGYLLALFLPVGLLATLAPAALALAAPSFALNLLSTDFHMFTALGDNSAEVIAVVMIAAILGTATLIRLLAPFLHRHRAGTALGIWLAVSALWYQHVSGYTPFGGRFQVPSMGAHQHVADRFVAMIPPSVPVATQDQLDPHLSSRRYLYLFADMGQPPSFPAATRLLLDVSAPTYPLPSDQLYSQAQEWLAKPGWGVKAAQDGLILIQKGVSSRHIPTGFYTYAFADRTPIEHRLRGTGRGLRMLGFRLDHTDLPNHRVPNLAYTLYLQPQRSHPGNLQPVIFETRGSRVVTCTAHALGLAWFPSSRWTVQHRYAVRMEPLETNVQTPGTVHLYADIVAEPVQPGISCEKLWRQRTHSWSLGTLSVQFF